MRLLFRLRYLALLLPAFALFSSLQVGCSTTTPTDDYATEDLRQGAGYYGYGYGYAD